MGVDHVRSSSNSHGSQVSKRESSHTMQNKECSLWPSYKGANDWEIFQLAPRTKDDKKGARDSKLFILDAMEARISLMMHTDDVGAVGMTDEAAIGYYLVKWLSKPYMLQVDTE